MSLLEDRLSQLGAARLTGMRRGVEKESLRSLATGGLALTPHPPALGAPLTHPRITTDYSESQLELITGVHADAEGCQAELVEIHQFVYQTMAPLGDERLWVGSMPCGLPTDETIPLGRYGASNVGRAKSVYRMGLGHRYGRRMQTISGIHYNWSLPGSSSDEYFALIRNFRRQSFLLLLLFGASPALCGSFVAGREHGLQPLQPLLPAGASAPARAAAAGGSPADSPSGTLHLPDATSLRMGRLGYQSDAQAKIAVSYNSLDSYAASLHDALTQPYPPYEAIGIRNLGGEYNQLATTLLQIENEFYGTIRPKRVIASGERPLHALRQRGVEYVEVRCMDLDPFEPVGIGAPTMRFLDVFLLHCLLSESAPDTPGEIAALGRNQQRAAATGRQRALRLERPGADGKLRETDLFEWAHEIVEQCAPIAATLDGVLHAGAGGKTSHYRDALAAARAALASPATLPSARVLATIAQEYGGSYTAFVRAMSERARVHHAALPWTREQQARYEVMAFESLRERQAIEAADAVDFETWRRAYLDPARLGA